MRRLVLAFFLFGCGQSNDGAPSPVDGGGADDATPDATAPCEPTRDVIDPSTASELTVVGDVGSARGIFDPSIVYPEGAPGGVMAYSSVPSQDAIFTRIALSADKGATWTYVADANAPVAISAASSECPGGSCTGRLIHEVSSIAIDPNDGPARRFKLFAHSYFAFPGTDPLKLRYDWGHIALFTAPEPKGPWSSGEKLLGWKSSMGSVSLGTAQNLNDEAGLASCVAFTEPSALATEKTIELALGCVELAAGTPTIRVVLLRSFDHAKSFSYVGTLLRPTDASCVSSVPQVNAAHLFGANGKVYVAASPAGAIAGGLTGYTGCVAYEVDDLGKGMIKPGLVRSITAAGDRFSGACSYAEETGWVLSVLRLESAPRTFQIFRTGIAIP